MSGYITDIKKIYSPFGNLSIYDIAETVGKQEKDIYVFLLCLYRQTKYLLCTPNDFSGTRKYVFRGHRKYTYLNFSKSLSEVIKEEGVKIKYNTLEVITTIDPNSRFLGWIFYDSLKRTITIHGVQNIPGSLEMIMKTLPMNVQS